MTPSQFRLLVGVIAAAPMLAAGIVIVGLRGQVQTLDTRLAILQAQMEAHRDLNAERATAITNALDALKRRQELQSYELGELADLVKGLAR